MSITLTELATVLTALIALAGLLFSIYNFQVARHEKAPRLKAKISNGFTPLGPELGPLLLIVEVANTGEKPVKVTGIALKWRHQSLVFLDAWPGTARLPHILAPGDAATFWRPMVSVASSLRREGSTGRQFVRASFQTAIGKDYLSKKFAINLDSQFTQ